MTISPRLQQGLPDASLLENGISRRKEEEASAEVAVDQEEAALCDDDDSDCDLAHEVRDRRVQLDLELVKPRSQRPGSTRVASSSSTGKPGHKDDQGIQRQDSVPPSVASKPERVEELIDDKERAAAARVAADLALLGKPGGAGSVALAAATVPAPLRQRSRTCAAAVEENADEEKAKRKAARKAAKEAARQSVAQELLMSIREQGVDVSTDVLTTEQMSAEEAKARRKAARRAAKEQAAKQLDAQQDRRHAGEIACSVRDAWTTGAQVAQDTFRDSKEVSVSP
jgi:hypothetical protein